MAWFPPPESDYEFKQKTAGPKREVEWRLQNAGLRSMVIFGLFTVLGLLTWLFASRCLPKT